MFGFLNIYKPKDITSHDVVSYLRRVTKIKQIGHTGTLDPFAEGVLPVCIGKSTRLIEYLSDDKAYIATVQFGKTTDTYDIEGEVLSESDIKVKEDELLSALTKYRGEIEQIPPKYSAIKVNGKKLYEYARAGVEVEIKPRKVVIEEIKLLSFDSNLQAAEIYIKCSKGTYIRTIGYDLGQDLGCGAYLNGLKRVQAGDFSVEDSIPLYDLKTVEDIKIVAFVLSDSVARRLREQNMKAGVVGVSIRDNQLVSFTRQKKLAVPTDITEEIAENAIELFIKNKGNNPLRSIGISLSDLVSSDIPVQMSFFENAKNSERLHSLDCAVDGLKKRFGTYCVQPAVMLNDKRLSGFNPKDDHTIHPVGYFTKYI